MVVAVAGSFSCEPLARWLATWLRSLGLEERTHADVRLASYGQLLQELASPDAFRGASACVGLLNFADWRRERGSATAGAVSTVAGGTGHNTISDSFDVARFEADVELLLDGIRAAMMQHKLPRLLLIVCPSLPSASTSHHYAAAASRIKALCAEHPRLAVLTPSEVAAWYPVAEPHDRVGDALGHMPYTEAMYCALAAASARAVVPSLAPSSCALVKCIAVDCDFTLWHGAVGEAGIDGLSCEPRHLELQERLLELRQRGVLLALCSKNLPNDVWEALASESLQTAIKREHVSAFRIAPALCKSDALRGLASELRLGVDNILLIDDNPAECAEVRASLPSVCVWCWPAANHAQARSELSHVWQLDMCLRPPPTTEDASRVASYESEARRREDLRRVREEDKEGEEKEEEKEEAVTGGKGGGANGSALVALHEAMQVKITFEVRTAEAKMAASTQERLLQLLERSNQFNAWKRGVPPPLLDECEALAMSVTDRYGVYGIVGAALCMRVPKGGGGGEDGEEEGMVMRVVALAMSCRVLGRGAEHALLARIGQLATEGPRPCASVAIGLVPTERNELVRRFLAAVDASSPSSLTPGGAQETGQQQQQQVDDEAAAAPAAAAAVPVVVDAGDDDDDGRSSYLERWLAEAPHAWHEYPAPWLGNLRFDPATVGALDGDAEAAADAPPASGGDGAPRPNEALAEALSRMPSEGRNIEQFMRRHGGGASLLNMPRVGAPTEWSADKLRDALRSLWAVVLGEQPTSMQDDVPFGAYGGNSVLAVQLIALADRHGVKLPHKLANSLDQCTIASLVPQCMAAMQGEASATNAAAATAAASVSSSSTSLSSAAPALKIIERDGRVPTMPLKPLGGLSACAAGDLAAARALAEGGTWYPAHAVDKHGTSALMWAAGGGHLQVVTWLLESQGVAVDKANKDGRTALMWACKNGHFAVAEYLVGTGGADVTLRMKDDSTAFDWAVLGGDEATMELLANHPRVDIHALNKFGCAAVQWAAAAGNVSSCRWLHAKGVDFRHVNTARHGAIVKSAWKGHDECLRWLLHEDDGPKLTWQLTMRDLDGRTVAELARMNGQHATADWLEALIVEEERRGS